MAEVETGEPTAPEPSASIGYHAAVAPDRVAVEVDGWGQLTYAELEASSNRLAHWFRSVGLQRGDHIAVVLENRPEVFTITWAAQRSGLYYTLCSTALIGEELEHIVRDCGATVLFCSDATAERLADVTSDAVKVRVTLDGAADGHVTLAEITEGRSSEPIEDESEGSDMLYSSGTTGRPKGVKIPLRDAPYPTLEPVGVLAQMLFGVGEDTVYLSPAPLYHAAPLRFCMAAMRLGAQVVVMQRFDAARFLQLLEERQATFTQVVPTMMVRLLKLPEEVRAAADTSSLKTMVHAAAPCPVAVKRQVIEWLGPVVHEYYAGSEGNGFVYCNSEDWLAHPGTVGRSLLGPIHILDEDGNEVANGVDGTVYFESAAAFEYHGDPEKTKGSRDPLGRGWSTLGDIGHLDDEGFLYLADRRAHLILSGGVNIYPQESENVLVTHPDVIDAAVFGIPDDEMGERVHAVVQLRPEVEPSPEEAEALIEHCRAHLARFKCPRTIDFREELPRLDNGKLYKRLLQAEFWPEPDSA